MAELPTPAEQPRSILIPLAFWMSLLASAALFASVSLAPRAVEWHATKLATVDRQQQLVRVERQIQQLEKVAYALEYDPQFRAELAAGQLSPSDLLTSDVEAPNLPLTVPWYVPVLRALSVSGEWRRRVLWLAAGLCVFAFVALRDPDRSKDAVLPGSNRSDSLI